MIAALLAATLLEMSQGGIDLKIEADAKVVDPARSVFLTVTVRAKPAAKADLPDLRENFVGFSLVEDFQDEPVTGKDGLVTTVTNWQLDPEPCAETYKVKPFALGGFVWGPVYFDNPPAREPVTGAMEAEAKKVLPPLSWKLVGWVVGGLVGLAAAVLLAWTLCRFFLRKLKEHRMSPIERAWVELDRLLKKGLPGRGRYKDFYVELTMVVRRYVQRKYGIRAPHLTTEEFLKELVARDSCLVARDSCLVARDGGSPSHEPRATSHALKEFLESADMVKFAGVEATPEMADDATESARGYLKCDAADSKKIQ